MGTKYPGVNISGYNDTPPSDDGQNIPGNEIEWDKHKSKLGDPIKDLAEAMNTAILLHVDESVRDVGAADTALPADHKRTLNVTGAFTVSLDDSANTPAGWIVWVKNSHTAAITVDLVQATDTLDGVAAGTFTIQPGQSVKFIKNAAANGYLSLVDTFVDPTILPTFITATADQIKGLDTTFANDAELFFTTQANRTYVMEISLGFEADSLTPDAKVQIVAADGTFFLSGTFNGSVSPDVEVGNESSNLATLDVFTNLATPYHVRLTHTAGGSGGTFAVQWAQVTSSSDQTRRLAGSNIVYWDLGVI